MTALARTADPTTFGRYKLLSLLGKGGMAEVYRGVLTGPLGFEKQVALKVLGRQLTKDPRYLKAMTNEARLGGQIHHRNVVEIYEFGVVDDRWFLAMEYVDGWTLSEVLDECRFRKWTLPPTVIVELMSEICAGLDHAHDLADKDGHPLELVHRDLKPENVIMSRTGEVKLMDFGVAKAESNLFKTTTADTLKGTPIYMSPEQASAQLLDRRSDLFSLGALLHEMVTLELPFQGPNLASIMNGIMQARLDPVLARMSNHGPAFCPLVQRLLAQSPDQRPATAHDVRKALAELEPTLPPGPTLRAWLVQVANDLPRRRAVGDFGKTVPPGAAQGPRGGSQRRGGPAGRVRALEVSEKRRGAARTILLVGVLTVTLLLGLTWLLEPPGQAGTVEPVAVEQP